MEHDIDYINKLQVLSIKQASIFMGVPASTLNNWRSAGFGPKYSKSGKHIKYLKKDILDYLEKRSVA